MSAAPLVDTHCHLHREEFDGDRDQIVARAREAGVGILLDPATTLASNRTVTDLTRRFPGVVYGAVGVHPHHAEEVTPAALEELERAAADPGVVAIGEIGLDYHRNLCPPETQRRALRQLLGLSRRRGRPAILHCREAYADLFPILRETLDAPMKGLLHCFCGDAKAAEEAAALGLYLSFAGNLTFPKADSLRAVAAAVPMERVVLETDAPFLAPQQRRGQRNEPAFLHELVRTWAHLRGMTQEEVARRTTENARRLFGFPTGGARGGRPP